MMDQKYVLNARRDTSKVLRENRVALYVLRVLIQEMEQNLVLIAIQVGLKELRFFLINAMILFLGNYNTGKGNIKCISCPKGKYQDQPKSNSCILCDPGEVNANEGGKQKSDCAKCNPGQYAPDPGMEFCVDCLKGTYSDQSGAAICTKCDLGTYNNFEGQSSPLACIECDLGTFASKMAQYYCDDCPAGTYQDNKKSSSCINCPDGTYQPFTRQASLSACVECEPGYYCIPPKTINHLKCPIGTSNQYTKKKQLSDCIPCAYDTYANEEGQAFCKNCPMRSESRILGGIICNCIKGSYLDLNQGKEYCPGKQLCKISFHFIYKLQRLYISIINFFH